MYRRKEDLAGFDLSEGKYNNDDVSSEELWKSFNRVFSTKTLNSSSYKFVFLKSIVDCIERYNGKRNYTFYEIFERFTEIYWVLIVKYGLNQNASKSKFTYIEQIFQEYVGRTSDKKVVKIEFDDITDTAKKKIVDLVVKKCKKYVVGALFEDTQELFYSFSRKSEWIELNPKMITFLNEHGEAIEELNYYELAKFLDKVNAADAVDRIYEEKENIKTDDSVNVYRQMLFDEFEGTKKNLDYISKINTIELLMVAEDNLYQVENIEDENSYLKELYDKEKRIENDSESMMQYLDDPERIIKMLKMRKGICC